MLWSSVYNRCCAMHAYMRCFTMHVSSRCFNIHAYIRCCDIYIYVYLCACMYICIYMATASPSSTRPLFPTGMCDGLGDCSAVLMDALRRRARHAASHRALGNPATNRPKTWKVEQRYSFYFSIIQFLETLNNEKIKRPRLAVFSFKQMKHWKEFNFLFFVVFVLLC